jgi:EmrB/QacA subfamily drug resistance transporter
MSTIASPLDTETDRLSARAWGTLIVLCGALFLDALDVSMMGVTLPSIRADLHISTSALQWVVSGYVLGYGGFLLLGGRAADLFGRRRMFLGALGVFAVASGLGGLATNSGLLIAARFVTGLSAAFTAPAGLSIITTSFREGPARNKALSIYTATGATGFSLGLVVGGALTDISWRLVFFVPVVLALVTLVGAVRLVPHFAQELRTHGFDIGGAITLTVAMVLLVFTVVEAPDQGWGSARTIGSLVAVAVVLAAFVVAERRVAHPLVRLGIFRSGSLVQANVGAMCLQGSWIGFQFIATLYMQELRGWSALEAGIAIFPGGAMVALLAPRIAAPLVNRFGAPPVIAAGLTSLTTGYALFLPIGLHSSYLAAMFPTFVLGGLGFALAYGPLTMAATNGIAAEEQGLASGLVNTSFQFGGALVLAIVTAVNDANTGADGTARALLDGFHPALYVPLVVAAIGLAATAVGLVRRPAPVLVIESAEELAA